MDFLQFVHGFCLLEEVNFVQEKAKPAGRLGRKATDLKKDSRVALER